MTDRTNMTETEFYELYQPIESPEGTVHEGNMMWDYLDTLTHDLHHVWSVVDGDETDNWYAIAGYHVVNVMGYCVTTNPWADGDEQGVFFDAKDFDDDNDDNDKGEPAMHTTETFELKTNHLLQVQHLPTGDGHITTVEPCEAPEGQCIAQHVYSVYERYPDGQGGTMARWIADCNTRESAQAMIHALRPVKLDPHAMRANVALLMDYIVGARTPNFEATRALVHRDGGFTSFIDSVIDAADGISAFEEASFDEAEGRIIIWDSFDWTELVDAVAKEWAKQPTRTVEEWKAVCATIVAGGAQ